MSSVQILRTECWLVGGRMYTTAVQLPSVIRYDHDYPEFSKRIVIIGK